MKERRIVFLALAAALLGAALYTGERIYFLVLFIMAGMAAASIATALLTFFRFHYLQRLTPATGVKGEEVRLDVEIHNDYLFPFPLVVLEYDLPEDWLAGVTPSEAAAVLPRSRYVFTRTFRCPYRGRFPVGLKSARFTDLFGLYAFTIRFGRLFHHRGLTLRVKPRVVVLPRLPLPLRETEGQVRSRLRASEDMSQMSDPRKYRPGDPLKKVHWKLTMRAGELMVKNYEQSSLPRVALYLDCRKTGIPGTAGVAMEDTLVECAVAVARYVLERGHDLRLIAYGARRVELTGSRPVDFQPIYDFLTDMAFDGEYPLGDVLLWEIEHIAQQGCLFVIAQELSEFVFGALESLRRAGVSATVILVHVPERPMDDDAVRMIHEMRENGIPTLVMTPFENLADKTEALR